MPFLFYTVALHERQTFTAQNNGTPTNRGQNFGDGECPLFRRFTVRIRTSKGKYKNGEDAKY